MNTNMTAPIIEQRNPEVDNPVSSFEVGIVTKQGVWVGICIKFSMYDKTTKLTHWSPHAFGLLMTSLTEYCNYLGENAFYFRAESDPSLLDGLMPRHPYHTLLSEVPILSEDEIGTAGLKTGIDQATFAVRGPTFELRPVFGDGRTESIYLHEYTALSLLAYLQEYIKAAKTLSGPAAGTA